jgi:tRNA(Ile)-lysidine synthase
MNFTDKLHSNLLKYRLLERGERLLVGVSGGADSVALLLALYELRHELGIEIMVGHFNHALRRSAVRDQAFAKGLAGRLGLRFVTETNRKKVPDKGSLEEFARDRRYDFLLRSARRVGAGSIALAHTQDDLAETVLMRILRGTGLAGLRSMSFKSCRGKVAVVRPMLNISRHEVEVFLKRKKARFVHDPTNSSLDFTRNKVRLKLIPYLEKHFAPDIKERLATLADSVALDYDFLENALEKVFYRVAERAEIRSLAYSRLHQAMRRMVLRALLEQIRTGSQALSLKHIDLIDKFITSSVKGQMSLPGGVKLVKNKNKIKLITLS